MKEELKKAHQAPSLLSPDDDDDDPQNPGKAGGDDDDPDGTGKKRDHAKPGKGKDGKKDNAFNRMAHFFVRALQGSGADLDW